MSVYLARHYGFSTLINGEYYNSQFTIAKDDKGLYWQQSNSKVRNYVSELSHAFFPDLEQPKGTFGDFRLLEHMGYVRSQPFVWVNGRHTIALSEYGEWSHSSGVTFRYLTQLYTHLKRQEFNRRVEMEKALEAFAKYYNFSRGLLDADKYTEISRESPIAFGILTNGLDKTTRQDVCDYLKIMC